MSLVRLAVALALLGCVSAVVGWTVTSWVASAWRNEPEAKPEQRVAVSILEVPEPTIEEPPGPPAPRPFDPEPRQVLVGVGGGAGAGHAAHGRGRRSVRAGGRASSVSSHRENTERYASHLAPGFRSTRDDPRITFAADVDTGSYSNVRRMLLRERRLPPANAVRVEELVNYFRYAGVEPSGEHPVAASIEIASCPWRREHRLAVATVRTARISSGARQPANLVFLLDVSGSMGSSDKLPLLQRSFQLLVDQLQGRDRVAIVVYAGSAGLVLPSTACSNKDEILDAVASLRAGGSTAGAQGIRLAYRVARQHFVPDGINRVLLATDGDFNVGISDREELVAMIEEEAADGIFLTTLGFGTGNLKEDTLEQLADRGNGHYAYIDSLLEARKVLVDELGATLEVVARDVKLQATFNPARVAAHRLVGYANRRLKHRDFADDEKDGGELGAGHQVTALFEIVPKGAELPDMEPGDATDPEFATLEGEALMRIDVRYKSPTGTQGRQVESFGFDDGRTLGTASEDVVFAAAVAWFAEAVREEPEPTPRTWDRIDLLARSAVAGNGTRAEFLRLIEAARGLRTAEGTPR